MKIKSILFGLFCFGMLTVYSGTVYAASSSTGKGSGINFSDEVGDPGVGKGKQLTVGEYSTVSEAYHDTMTPKKSGSGRQRDRKKQ